MQLVCLLHCIIMIIPAILHAIYPQYEKAISLNIERFQIAISSIASLACLYGVNHYNQYQDYNTLWTCCLFIFYFVCTDIFFCKFESFIHHFIAIGCFTGYWIGGGGYNLVLDYSPEHVSWVSIVMKATMATEISTIFLNLRQLLMLEYPNRFPNLRNAMEFCFVATFTYNRIYIFPKNVVFNHLLYENYTMGYIVAFGLFLLNLYWFAIIVKKIFGLFRHVQMSQMTVEYMLQYSCFTCLCVSLVIYYPYDNSIFWPEISARFCLACTSYYYHNALYTKLKSIYPNIEFDVMADDILPFYYADACTIILTSFTNFHALSLNSNGVISYYLNCSKCDFMNFMFYFYISFAIMGLGYLKYLKLNDIYFSYCETKGGKYTIINTLLSIPLGTGLFISFVNIFHSNMKMAIWIFISIYCMGLIRVMNVGYKFNHLLFHGAYMGLTICTGLYIVG